MQYSLFDELMLAHRLAALERRDVSRAVEAEALCLRPSLRESVAAAFVRLGIRLDHAAGERALSALAGRPAR